MPKSRRKPPRGDTMRKSESEITLKPCPFCAASLPWIRIIQHDNDGSCQVECYFCGATGPQEAHRELAVQDWNSRLRSKPKKENA